MITRRPLFHTTVAIAFFVAPTLAWFFDRVGIVCGDEETSYNCMAGGLYNFGGLLPFSGTYMCRERRRWFFFKRNQTMCVPTIFNGVIAQSGDRCGCCEGDCPKRCTCRCRTGLLGDYDVWVQRDKGLFGFEVECVSQGKASRRTADEYSGYSCVPNDECYLYTDEPTYTPSMEPTYEPTVAPTPQPTISAEPSYPDFFVMAPEPTFANTESPSA